jgi:hypothetical protein
MRDDPFPFEAVRDLLGILRALYAAEKRKPDVEGRLLEIERIALELRAAKDLAMEVDEGTLGHNAAWTRAEKATARLCDLIDRRMPAESLIRAAAGRVSPMKRIR